LADIILVLVTLAFFGLCAAYVRALDHMVASTQEPDDAGGSSR